MKRGNVLFLFALVSVLFLSLGFVSASEVVSGNPISGETNLYSIVSGTSGNTVCSDMAKSCSEIKFNCVNNGATDSWAVSSASCSDTTFSSSCLRGVVCVDDGSGTLGGHTSSGNPISGETNLYSIVSGTSGNTVCSGLGLTCEPNGPLYVNCDSISGTTDGWVLDSTLSNNCDKYSFTGCDWAVKCVESNNNENPNNNGNNGGSSSGRVLPTGVTPNSGYFLPTDDGGRINVWDGSKMYAFNPNSLTWNDITSAQETKGLPAGFVPVVAYYSPIEGLKGIHAWDSSGRLYIFSDGAWTLKTSAQVTLGLDSGFKPTVGYYDAIDNSIVLFNSTGDAFVYGETSATSCVTKWRYDSSDATPVCAQSQKCGTYMTATLHEFDTEADCEASLNPQREEDTNVLSKRLYEYYNASNKDHFYSFGHYDWGVCGSDNTNTYCEEPEVIYAYDKQVEGSKRLYRYYSASNKDHFYSFVDGGTYVSSELCGEGNVDTTNNPPKSYCKENEDIYAYDDAGKPSDAKRLYRYYSVVNKDHLYTFETIGDDLGGACNSDGVDDGGKLYCLEEEVIYALDSPHTSSTRTSKFYNFSIKSTGGEEFYGTVGSNNRVGKQNLLEFDRGQVDSDAEKFQFKVIQDEDGLLGDDGVLESGDKVQIFSKENGNVMKYDPNAVGEMWLNFNNFQNDKIAEFYINKTTGTGEIKCLDFVYFVSGAGKYIDPDFSKHANPAARGTGKNDFVISFDSGGCPVTGSSFTGNAIFEGASFTGMDAANPPLVPQWVYHSKGSLPGLDANFIPKVYSSIDEGENAGIILIGSQGTFVKSGSEGFVSTNLPGVPEGLPDAGYYDALEKVAVLWYGSDRYVSSDGITFVNKNEQGVASSEDTVLSYCQEDIQGYVFNEPQDENPNVIRLYRYYNDVVKDHYYSTDDTLSLGNYVLESEQIYVLTPDNTSAYGEGIVPLYEVTKLVHEPLNGDSFYTTNLAEAQRAYDQFGYNLGSGPTIIAYVYGSDVEGVSDLVPLRRYWSSVSMDHFYSTEDGYVTRFANCSSGGDTPNGRNNVGDSKGFGWCGTIGDEYPNGVKAEARVMIDGVLNYCDYDGNYHPTFDLNAECSADYQCGTNFCLEGNCTSLKEINEQRVSLLTRILCLIKSVVVPGTNYDQCMAAETGGN